MNEGGKQGFFQRFVSGVKNRAGEGAAFTGLTQAGNAVSGAGEKAAHSVQEAAGGAINTLGEKVQAAGGIAERAGMGLSDVASALPDVAAGVGMNLNKADAAMRDTIHVPMQDVVGRTAAGVGTFGRDRLSSALATLMRDPLKEGLPTEVTTDQQEMVVEPPTPEVAAAREKVNPIFDATTMVKDVVGQKYESAVAFDARRKELVVRLLTESVSGGEVGQVLGRAVVESIIAVMMDNESAQATTSGAADKLATLMADPDLGPKLKLMDGQAVTGVILEILNKQKEINALILEARGADKGLSWEYEGMLETECMEAQAEAQRLGWAVLDSLPANAADLTHQSLANARKGAGDFSRATHDITAPLINIAHSLEKRFPGQKAVIKDKLIQITEQWRTSKKAFQETIQNFNPSELMPAVKNSVDSLLLDNSDALKTSSLTPEQRSSVLAAMGCKEGENGYESTDDKGKYANVIKAGEQFAKLAAAYEISRENAETHPELAAQLMILAESIVAAKSGVEMSNAHFRADLALRVRDVRNQLEEKTLEATHAAAEYDHAVDRRGRYTTALERMKARLEDEAPKLKRLMRDLAKIGIGAVAVTAAVGVAGEIGSNPVFLEGITQSWHLVVEAARLLNDAMGTTIAEAAPQAKLGAQLVLEVGVAAISITELQRRLHMVVEKKVEKKLTKEEEFAASELKKQAAALEKLAESFDKLDTAKAAQLRASAQALLGG